MNAKTCKQLRRLAGTHPRPRWDVRPEPPRYVPFQYFERWMEVQDTELDAHGNLPTNPDGTPKMRRFDYLVIKPIRVNLDSPRGRYLDLKTAQRQGRAVRPGTYSTTGLSMRVGV